MRPDPILVLARQLSEDLVTYGAENHELSHDKLIELTCLLIRGGPTVLVKATLLFEALKANDGYLSIEVSVTQLLAASPPCLPWSLRRRSPQSLIPLVLAVKA